MTLLLLLACGSHPSPAVAPSPARTERPAGCATTVGVTWESWGQGFFLTYCDACHSTTSSNRNGAPADVNFDTAADVTAWKDRISARVLDEGTMPVGGGVYDADLELLRVLLACDL